MKIFLIAAAIVTAAGLAVNALVHFNLAGPFDANVGTLLSQGALFRIQAVVDILAAALILFRPRRWTGLIAAVVALGGLALILITVNIPLDLTAIGLPYLFEPVWYQDKYVSAIVQAIAAVAAIAVAIRAKSIPAAKPQE